MFSSKKPDTYGNVDSLLGTNSTIEGNMNCEGTVRIDGKIKGDLRVSGNLYIGETGIIKGNICANNIDLAGIVEGNVVSDGLLRILSTAKILGDIKVHSLVTDEGGQFFGKCTMIESQQTYNEELD